MGAPADGWVIERGEEGWPSALEELARVPGRIFGLGDPAALLGPCVSIVGARRATPYGLAIAEMAARISAECGITVVSGGAMGCDHSAGSAAIMAGGKTIVVSGCGADAVYPSTSSDVFEGAVAGGGAVISVEPWGSGPKRWSFPRRNELIAALSHVLIVTEAGRRSGTMYTAEAAVELGRIVYAIPGSIFSPNSSGTNRLLSEGARVIADETELSTAISLDYGLMRLGQKSARGAVGPVLSALVASPARPDELAERLNESVLTVMRTLTDHEARGLVERLPDGRYSPTQSFYLGQNEGVRVSMGGICRTS